MPGSFQIFRDLFNRLIRQAVKGLCLRRKFLDMNLRPLYSGIRLFIIGNLLPETIQKPMSANHSAVIPLGVLLGRTDKKDVETLGICPIFVNEDIRTHHIASGLGHLGPVLDDHTLAKDIAGNTSANLQGYPCYPSPAGPYRNILASSYC